MRPERLTWRAPPRAPLPMATLVPAFLDEDALTAPMTRGLATRAFFCSNALPGRLDSYSCFSAFSTLRGAVLAAPLNRSGPDLAPPPT